MSFLVGVVVGLAVGVFVPSVIAKIRGYLPSISSTSKTGS